MKKINFLVIVTLCSIVNINLLLGQEISNQQMEPAPKWMVGSDLDLAFGRRFMDSEIAPFIGYKIFKKFEVGLKVPISFSKFRYTHKNKSAGIGIYGRYYIRDRFFLFMDYGIASVRRDYADILEHRGSFTDKFNADFWNAGIGYRSKGKLAVELRLNYNIFSEQVDIYNSSEGVKLKAGISCKF